MVEVYLKTIGNLFCVEYLTYYHITNNIVLKFCYPCFIYFIKQFYYDKLKKNKKYEYIL
jgi:hypothetical protein